MRKIELPKGRFADIAEEDDLTVQEQWDIEHAGIASESVSAHTTILQLEELRTLEAELTAIVAAPKTGPVRRREAQERLKLMSDARATTALALAYQKLGPEEYAPIDRYEVVRVMCFLRSWDVPGPDGQPIPIPADRSPASVAAFAAVAPNSAMKVISAETVKTNTAPADFERSQEALLPKASATPTGGSSGSGSPAASRSAKGGTGRPTASRSTRARKSSSRRTGS